jgi:GxxExxY protein
MAPWKYQLTLIKNQMELNRITELIIGCGIKIHQRLGPGLLESSYLACLCYELEQVGLIVRQQVALPLIYEKVILECGYRLDLIVENKVIVEVKSVEALKDVHTAQVLTYLRLTNAELGLLMNFNVGKLIDGIKRVAPRK